MRAVTLRLVELRALFFFDPAARLRFLRRRMVELPAENSGGRAVRWWLLSAFTASLALASSAWVQPEWKGMSGWKQPAPAAAVAMPGIPAPTMERATPGQAPEATGVWLVETNSQFELYSNGLRVETRFAASTTPRRYLAFPRMPGAGRGKWRTEPAGIVFHTTESHMAPFEAGQNSVLKRAGEGLLDFVRRNRSYHFVIDRFGQVYRVVRESDYANHAGNSVWADESWIYINLNQSFIGVAFEAQTRPEAGQFTANEAQVHAARVLTEMLRARYRIAAANCVTHAQVSVNPDNLLAGYHTDWVTGLPFGDLGLIDNYSAPLPSVALFGFGSDVLLAEAGGSPLTAGIQAANEQVRREARERGLTEVRYRQILHARYKQSLAALSAQANYQESPE